MRENVIEAYLRDRVKEIGGKAYKFVSPGNDGVPDRLVCLPGRTAIFVETKAPGKKPTPLQKNQQHFLRSLGFAVYGRVDTKEKVDRLIRALKSPCRSPLEAFRDLGAFDE